MEYRQSEVDRAAEIIRRGGVVVYPTETVYGLGADILNEVAVSKVCDLKGRGFKQPLSIAVSKDRIEEYAEVSEKARELIDKYLPGPLTLVLKKKASVPGWISHNEFVGIRVPDHKMAQGLLGKVGAITSTSANLSGCGEAGTVEDISLEITDHVDFVLDGGEAKYKKASTVVRVTDKIEVLRQGGLVLDE